MKKLATTLLGLIISGSAAYALPIGNPWEASIMCDGVFLEGHCADYCDPCVTWCDAWSLRIGFYGDYVFDRHMELDKHHGTPTVHDTEIWTNAGYWAFNLWDRFDLFGTLGTTRIAIATPRSSFSGTSNDYGFVGTETNFSWSLGVRATLWECGCLGIGGEAQYFSTRPDINFIREENQPPDYSSNDTFKYREWQVGFGAAYRINIACCSTAFIPYLGIKWSRAQADLGDARGAGMVLPDLRSDRYFGYAFGLTLLGCNKSSVTVETRFVDEKALYVNAQFRF